MSSVRQYVFGDFRLDVSERALFRHTELVPLTPKALETLIFLVERQGHIVEKRDLMKAIWPDTFVEEVSLARNISVLRKVLSEGSDGKDLIETITKRGYRFVGDAREIREGEAAAIASASAPALPAHRRHVRPRLVWTGALAALILLAAGFMAYSRYNAGEKTLSRNRVMLAVLPVQNLTGNLSQDYVTDGLTEEVIAELGSINPERLGVIARTSSMSYKQTSKTIDQIGKELGVDYVLESSVRESGGQIRFTVQLIRTRDQTHIWAHSYERPKRDTLQMQNELANTVAAEVRVDFSPARQSGRSKSRHTADTEAYDAFVQGRYHANQWSRPELHRAVMYFQRAIDKDPEFAEAYSGLADAYAQLASMREYSPAEAIPKAKDALLKALALDDSLADAHTSLAWTMDVYDWDWAGAEKEYRRALELNPNDASAHHRFALHLADMGNFPEALAQIRQARELDPISPVMVTSTGWIFLRSRLTDRAQIECEQALELDPRFVRAHLCLGEVYEQRGELQKAANKFLDGRVAAGENPELIARLRQTIVRSGYEGYFRARLAQRREEAAKGYVSPYDFADAYIRLGEKEQALTWLERACQERSAYLANLQIEPRFDFLRSEPRFQELVRRVGLTDVHLTLVQDSSLPAKTARPTKRASN